MTPHSTTTLLPGARPYELPLTPEAFRAALRDGRGRARLHAERHGLEGVIDDVVHATLHNLALDPQEEGGRGEWMVDMLDAAGELKAALRKLRAELRAPAILVEGLNKWDRSQRCGVLVALARRGEPWAREELLTVVRDDREWRFGYALGTEHLLGLDGAAGLLSLAAALGQRASRLDPGDIEIALARGLDDEKLEEANSLARATLREAPASCIGAQRLLAAFEAQAQEDGREEAAETGNEGRPRRAPQESAVDEIAWVEALQGEAVPEMGQRPERLRGWASGATPEALRELAQAWVCTTTDHRRYAYARAFSLRGKVPFVHEKMIEMAESRDEAVSNATRRALRKQHDPRVRAMALRHLDAAGLVDGWHALLAANFETGDEVLLEQALRDLLRQDQSSSPPDRIDRESWHTVTRSLDTLGGPDNRETLGPLIVAAFELSPCGECRGFIASTMHSARLAPRWVREEIEHQPRADEEDWPWDEAPAT